MTKLKLNFKLVGKKDKQSPRCSNYDRFQELSTPIIVPHKYCKYNINQSKYFRFKQVFFEKSNQIFFKNCRTLWLLRNALGSLLTTQGSLATLFRSRFRISLTALPACVIEIFGMVMPIAYAHGSLG